MLRRNKINGLWCPSVAILQRSALGGMPLGPRLLRWPEALQRIKPGGRGFCG